MSRENQRLSRLGVLAPAALSACMDASVLAVPAAGAIVSTVLKELSKAFMLKKWFHGVMSAKEAEHLMMEKGKNGSYLVRESKARPGDYVLSVRVRGRVSHVMINRQDNKYNVGSGEQFDDLVGLIEHFRSYPMIETTGDVLRLLQPVSGGYHKTEKQQKLPNTQEMEDSSDVETKETFDGEFQLLQAIHNDNLYTFNEGIKLENRAKNRYRNVLPYDQTRVVLRQRDDKVEGDYINANYIRTSGLTNASSVQSSNESLDSIRSLTFKSDKKRINPLVSKSLSDEALREIKRCMKMDKINGNVSANSGSLIDKKTYIATQGCLSNTRNDFWRMIWQEDVRVIVMITKEVEEGKKKCEKYWPSSGETEIYDTITVKSISEEYHEDYLVRHLNVSEDKKCNRIIYQYQFTAWPDHGTPTVSDGVLAFITDIDRRLKSIMQSKNRPEQNILCVHCSAGVGRTGTFIVLDIIVDRINKYGSHCDTDVASIVRLVRSQRSGMVQNKSQYQFIHMAIKDYIDKRTSRQKVYYIEA